MGPRDSVDVLKKSRLHVFVVLPAVLLKLYVVWDVSFCLAVDSCPDGYYPLSYGVPVRERYGSTFLPATREQHDQNCTQSH